MRKHIDLVATIGLITVVAMLAASAWLADGNTRQLVQNERWVKHTYDVLVGLDALLVTVLDAETGQRGYLLTGDSRFLQPYRQAIERVDHLLKRLAVDTSDNSAQQQRLAQLGRAINMHLRALSNALSSRLQLHPPSRLDALDRGKRSMDKIRDQVAGMRQEEAALLGTRMQRSSESFRTTRLVFFGTAAATTALVLVTHALLRRDIVGRRRANARLESANLRLHAGLRAAANVQASLLPATGMSLQGLKQAWAFQPCEELAGDALNICPLADGQVAVYLLDVSGHGAAAALSAVSVIQALTPTDGGRRLAIGVESPVLPAATLQSLDGRFAWDDAVGQFFTICFGVVDAARSTFVYASAGHPAPVLHQPNMPPRLLEPPPCLPIGVGDDYNQSSVRLSRGDRLYLYSDGVIETMNSQGQLFGSERFLRVLAQCAERDLQPSIDAVLDELSQWRGDAAVADDVSLVAIEVT